MQLSNFSAMKVVVLLLCTALSYAGGKQEQQTKPIELVVWEIPNHPEMEKMTGALLTSYEKENNVKVSVQVIPENNLDSMIVSAIQSDEPPAFVYTYDFVLPNYYRMGGIEPLEQYFSKEELSKFMEEPLKSAYYNGHLWAIPCLVTTNPLIYNVDYFAKAGIKVPDDPTYSPTWEEFLGWCQKLKAAGYGAFDYGLREVWDHPMDDFFMRFGARLTNEDGTRMAFDSPDGLRAARAWRDLAPTLTPKALSMAWNYGDEFFEGKVSMMEQGAWMTQTLLSDYPNINWKVILPFHDKEYKAYLGIGYYMVFKAAKNKAEVIKLLKFMTSEEHSAPWNEQIGSLPAIKGAGKKIYLNAPEKQKQTLDMMVHLLETGQAKYFSVFQGFTRFANEYFLPDWQSLMFGKTSPEAFVKKVDENGNRILKEELSK